MPYNQSEGVKRMIVYHDIFERLTAAGWSAYRLRKERRLGEATMTAIRKNEPVSTETIDIICALTGCQPGDIMRWEPDRD